MSNQPTFYTYILTNWNRTVIYVGCTNDIAFRLVEHWVGKEGSFTTRYKTYFLVWLQPTRYVLNAIATEKEIKLLTRAKKDALIAEFNPEWRFLNEPYLGSWPPTEEQMLAIRERWMKEAQNATESTGLRWF